MTWIKCSVQMPPVGKPVAVLPGKGLVSAGILRIGKGGGAQWYVMGRMPVLEYDYPIAWQPLPERPEVGP